MSSRPAWGAGGTTGLSSRPSVRRLTRPSPRWATRWATTLSTVRTAIALLILCGAGFGTTANAHEGPVAESTSAGPAAGTSPGAEQDGQGNQAWTAPSRFRGSILLFDQSVTTQTVGIGADYQSANPTYEWWLAFKPRYRLWDSRRASISVGLWMNLYLELTNSDTTTRKREPLLGPTYASASYALTLREVNGAKTVLAIGPRLTFPTDKAAWDGGQIMGVGATAELSQSFPLKGKGARALNGARLAAGTIVNHPFSRFTVPVDSGLHQLRQDVAGRLIVSDQLRGQENVENSLTLLGSGELQLLPRLELSASYVLINSWVYAPPAASVGTLTGPAPVMDIVDPTTFRVNTWLTASVSYQATDAMSVAFGYYNLANQIGPDGTRRDPLWSPSARLSRC